MEEKLHDLKDTTELIADYLSSVIEPTDENRYTFSINSDSTSSEARVPQVPITASDFTDMANQVFNKFRRSVVRYFYLSLYYLVIIPSMFINGLPRK